MKSYIIQTVGFLFVAATVFAQRGDSLQNIYQNSAERLLSTNGNLLIGGYGEVHYNQPVNSGKRNNGKFDVHRIVMLFGYRFNSRIQFISEIEFEHVKEVFVEQAFLQYKIHNFINLRGGLLLMPMGIINEYHEPTSFNGVERPFIDKYISPTTWREIGLGLSGNIFPLKIKYQVYAVNGFKSYDGEANLNGKNGLRNGRQKGAESFASYPNFVGKVEFYGMRGLNIGISGYLGKTQSLLYQGLSKDDLQTLARADSSVVGISMIGLDARYSMKGFQLRGQYYFTSISNTIQYNIFTADNGIVNDLGSSMTGYYVEVGYNVFRLLDGIGTELIPFLRYEALDTQNTVEKDIVKNKQYNQVMITTGLTWKIVKGAVLKADVQFLKSEADDKYANVFNVGFGYMF